MSSPSDPQGGRPIAGPEGSASGATDATIIDVWNLHEGVTAACGAQKTFNVVGEVTDASVEHMTYELNGQPPHPVFLQPSQGAGRLEHPGHFNVDTIDRADLADDNTLVLRAQRTGGEPAERTIRFGTRAIADVPPSYALDLAQVSHIEEVCQVVEGNWHVRHDREGITLPPGTGGYDRVALLARTEGIRNYEVSVTLRVDRWLNRRHNVGLVFDWHGHDRGDGSSLPQEWTTGLAYYCSKGSGLRLRIGIGVENIGPEQRRGDVVLAQKPLSRWRDLASRLSRRLRLPRVVFPQIRAGLDHRFTLRVRDGVYRLSARDLGRDHVASVQAAPPPLLAPGAVGVIAHRCEVTIRDFTVLPL